MISKGRVTRIGLFFAIANFLATAGIGVLLRYNGISPIESFSDRYWIHAHSHAGFLGWIFMALVTLAFAMILPKSARTNRRMYRLLIYMQIAVIGMLVTFPFMGYAAPSIFFSTAHMIFSFVFVVLFFRQVASNSLSVKFFKAGLVFMLISGLGPIALGPIIVFDLRDTAVYDMAVYFYLHFQYNGWFTLAVFGLLFKFMEDLGSTVDSVKGRTLYRLLVYSVILTLALSAIGFQNARYARVVGIGGALMQLWAGYLLLMILFKKDRFAAYVKGGLAKWLFGIALFSWLLKIMMQMLSGLPVISDFVYLSRDAIMMYLHLSFLGFATCFIFGLLLIKNHLFTINLVSKIGFGVIVTGIIVMEVAIGLRSLPQYLSLELMQSLNQILFFDSILIFTGVFIILFFAFLLSNRAIKQRYYS